MDGRALTASELAETAGITKQTASVHLSKLEAAQLLAREVQGRHRYFRLADDDVAVAIEALMGVAARGGGNRVRTGPNNSAMRRARRCYDHLAGDLAVALFDRMLDCGMIVRTEDGEVILTAVGTGAMEAIGIDVESLRASRRPLCKACLDWSARRAHLGGALGSAFLKHAVASGWVREVKDSRALRLTDLGAAHLGSIGT
jgi:hypothetical protein